MVQAVEHLSSKCKALRSNPSIQKKKKNCLQSLNKGWCLHEQYRVMAFREPLNLGWGDWFWVFNDAKIQGRPNPYLFRSDVYRSSNYMNWNKVPMNGRPHYLMLLFFFFLQYGNCVAQAGLKVLVPSDHLVSAPEQQGLHSFTTMPSNCCYF
jgi:hypothetical protein